MTNEFVEMGSKSQYQSDQRLLIWETDDESIHGRPLRLLPPLASLGPQFPGVGWGIAGGGGDSVGECAEERIGEAGRFGRRGEGGPGNAGEIGESCVRSKASSGVIYGNSSSILLALIHCMTGDDLPPLAFSSIPILLLQTLAL